MSKSKASRQRSAALVAVINKADSLADLGDRIGTSKQAVARWSDVPLERLPEVSEAMGLPPSQVRPDYVRRLFELEQKWTTAALPAATGFAGSAFCTALE